MPSLPDPTARRPHRREDAAAIDAALTELGVRTSRDDPATRKQMCYGMFDTRGSVSLGGGVKPGGRGVPHEGGGGLGCISQGALL
jgi:hypothetical protein